MNRNNFKIKTSISIVLVLLLMLNSVIVFAEMNHSLDSIIKEDNGCEKTINKVEKQVINAFAEDEYVKVMVYLNEKANFDNIKELQKNQLNVANSIEVKNIIIDELKSTADKSQRDLISYIDEEVQNGNVLEYKPFYITNAIYVKCSKDVVDNMAEMSEVEKIFLNEEFKVNSNLFDISNSIYLSKNLDIESKSYEWNLEKLGAPEAWDDGIDGHGIVIGIIGSGVEWRHEAIKEQWRGYDPDNPYSTNRYGNWYDPIYNSEKPNDDVDSPSGTVSTGLVLGDGEYRTGVAPKAKWIAAKALLNGAGFTDWITDCAEWMLAPEGRPELAPDVVLCPINGETEYNEWLRDIVKAWRAAGIVPITSAGDYSSYNNEENGIIKAPANYPEFITITAVDSTNRRLPIACTGPTLYDKDVKPDLSAPGESVRSTVPGGYEVLPGSTGIAAPLAAGVVALLKQASNKSLTVDEIESILKESAIPLEDDEYSGKPNYGYGYGLINIPRVLDAMETGRGTIKGKVFALVEDELDPTIIPQEIDIAYKGTEIAIDARVIDNIGINQVNLMVKENEGMEWSIIPMKNKEEINGINRDGIYRCTIPAVYTEGSGFIYKIKAVDFNGNESITQEYSVENQFGILPDQYENDFEKNANGWSFTGDWQWGKPERGVGGPMPKSGSKLLGTNLKGDYSYNTESMLITPPIDLRDKSNNNPILRLYQWFDIDFDDSITIYISEDGGNQWKPTQFSYDSFDVGIEWSQIDIDLSEYIGSNKPIYVGFKLQSDDYKCKPGWYIDDVKLLNTSEENKMFKSNVNNMEFNIAKAKPIRYEQYEINSNTSHVPLYAEVIVLETGIKVYTNPLDGSFEIDHLANDELEEWTLKAEAYGCKSKEVKVGLSKDGTVVKDIQLEKLPVTSIKGKIVDNINNKGIPGVELKILEDDNVPIIETDNDGNFIINNVMEGDYTIVLKKYGFLPKEIKVTVEKEKDIYVEYEMTKFVGKEEEIAYDDGSAEDGIVMHGTDSGFVVRMSPKGYGQVIGANIFFLDEKGAEDIAVIILDQDKRLIGKKLIKVKKGAWNYVDLSEFKYFTDEDFYLGTSQTKVKSAFIGKDLNGSGSGRSYSRQSYGKLHLLNDGNLMIRGVVEYPITEPVILKPSNNSHVNTEKVQVEGISTGDNIIRIYVNEKLEAEIQAIGNRFEAEVSLNKDSRNTIVAKELIDGEEKLSSKIINVYKDKLPDAEPLGNLPTNAVIVGTEAFDIKYLNNNPESQMKLIEYYNQGKTIYIKLAANTIVDIKGSLVDIEVLPELLTYYDQDGNTTKYNRN